MGRSCNTHGRGEKFVENFNPEGKKPIRKTMRRWEDNIKIDLVEGVDWIQVPQDTVQWWALMKVVMKSRVPS
jgi:hypothetical protein